MQSVQRRLDAFRRQARVQAGSLIISVFGDAVLPRGGRIWLGSLIRLLQPLELNERLVRTSAFRLVQDEWLRTEACGRRADYMPTPAGQRRFEDASRHIYAAHAPNWDRRWRLILVVGELDPKKRERLRRALFWQGFGMLGAECFVHPGADLGGAFEALVAEGMADVLKQLMPLLAVEASSGLAASNADLVARSWNLDKLALAYTEFVALYLPILEELRLAAQLEDEAAFLLRTLLIHDYRRLLLRDPELPAVLLPAGWPGEKARQLTREIYRRLLVPSERHLERQLQLANGQCPDATDLLSGRFREDGALV